MIRSYVNVFLGAMLLLGGGSSLLLIAAFGLGQWSRRLLPRRIFKDPTELCFLKNNATSASSMTDEHFMKLALAQAQRAGQRGEVPIGAIVVHKETTTESEASGTSSSSSSLASRTRWTVVSQAHNLVEQRKDASAHAELLALRQAAKRLGNWRLTNCTLYSTLEPCPLCASASLQFRIDRIVYGAPDHRLGAVVSHMRLLQDHVHPYHNVSDVTAGVYANQSATLLRDFFRARRKKA